MPTTFATRWADAVDDEVVLRGTLHQLAPGATLLIESAALRTTKRLLREQPGRFTLTYQERRFYLVRRATPP